MFKNSVKIFYLSLKAKVQRFSVPLVSCTLGHQETQYSIIPVFHYSNPLSAVRRLKRIDS